MADEVPKAGMLARVRNRLAIATDVRESATDGATEHLVELDYTDHFLPPSDSVLWGLEPGAQLIPPDGFPRVLETGPMRLREFEAVRRAVRWNALNAYVSDVGADLSIVAPFLGGIQVEDYQLVPLARALAMPRVALALFDDVGLGKTVEAGLVIGELIRRRRIRRILVLCPAWLRRQWKDEMESKFGLDFSLVDLEQTAQLRRELGMETNPWATFPRIIASYHYLKQEDVLGEFLLAGKASGSTAATLPWDLLVVDEVHNCMPAAHGQDSDLARMLVRIGRLFEHKVFLSATPHNGFTQSFTGLLAQLDPVRFNKKDMLTAPERKRVGEVVVRRLKKDINSLDEEAGRVPRFVQRDLQPAIQLPFGAGEKRLLQAFETFRTEFKRVVGSAADQATRTAGNFVIEVLSKRLLSCPYTFAVSWSRFVQGLEHDDEATAQAVRAAADAARAESERDDETETRLSAATRISGAWAKRDRHRLEASMQPLSEALAGLGLMPDSEGAIADPIADARVDSLLNLIRDRLGPAAGWAAGERLIVFTEYRTTLDYLARRVKAAFPKEPEGRFLQLYGGMPDGQREAIKAAFNDPADVVRVLLATDAASEGANLQETARMVLHYDLPWNPSRIDQRNGRLDRHGQSRDVEVYHFTSDTDSGLRFLDRLFMKVEKIRTELGSMSKLIDEAIERRFLMPEKLGQMQLLDDEDILAEIDKKAEVAKRRQRADLESTREDGREHRKALADLRLAIDLSPDALRDTLEVALATSGEPFSFRGPEDQNRYRMSSVPAEFRFTIDSTLRKKAGAGAGSLMAVQFAAEDQLVQVGGRRVHRPPKDSSLLHLGHPLVRQALQALAICRFPGAKRHSTVSRWSATRGPVEPGCDAMILVTVEETAMNGLRELFHQWVSVLRLPVRKGAVGRPMPYTAPDQERTGRTEALDLAQDAKDMWADLAPEVGDAVKAYAAELEQRIRAKLAKDLSAARSEQDRVFRERHEMLERQLSKGLSAKRAEMESLFRDIAQSSLFEEDTEALRLSQAKLEEEMEADRARCLETLEFLKREHGRVARDVIPRRYALPERVNVYPVAVEIRFPGGQP